MIKITMTTTTNIIIVTNLIIVTIVIDLAPVVITIY